MSEKVLPIFSSKFLLASCLLKNSFVEVQFGCFLICLFWLLHLSCCASFSLVVGSMGYSLDMVCRLLIAVTAFVSDPGLQVVWALLVLAHELSSCSSWGLEHRLNSCDALASFLCGMWDPPRPEIETVPCTGRGWILYHQGSWFHVSLLGL